MFAEDRSSNAIAIHLISEEGLDAWRAAQPLPIREWLAACSFRADRNQLALLPASNGAVGGVIVGLGKQANTQEVLFWVAAGLPDRVPNGRYRVESVIDAALSQFALGWAYGRYRFERYKKAANERVLVLEIPASVERVEIERIHAGCSLARDLVNTPACDLSPADLAATATEMAKKNGASCRVVVGDDLLIERQFSSAPAHRYAVGR
jgi:leucyl aminopeptidase